MIRLLLSLIILTLLVTYVVIPFVKYIKKFFKSEAKRINNAYIDENQKEEDEEKE